MITVEWTEIVHLFFAVMRAPLGVVLSRLGAAGTARQVARVAAGRAVQLAEHAAVAVGAAALAARGHVRRASAVVIGQTNHLFRCCCGRLEWEGPTRQGQQG